MHALLTGGCAFVGGQTADIYQSVQVLTISDVHLESAVYLLLALFQSHIKDVERLKNPVSKMIAVEAWTNTAKLLICV